MTHIDIELELRKKFGVTIHKNMSIPEMVAQWDRVPMEIRNAYPQITATMEVARGAIVVYDNANAIYSSFAAAYHEQQEILEAGSAMMYAPTLPATKLAEVAQAVILETEIAAFNATTDLLYQKMVSTLTH